MLFLFTIGPVKSFIESSRKTRDLYAGSYLLSYLMRLVYEELRERHPEVEIVFPLSVQSNIPNRLIAKVNGYSLEDQKKLGQELSGFVRRQFVEIGKNVFKKTKVMPNQAAMNQLERFLEVYWAFEEESSYSLAYSKVNQSMSSIKRLRGFAQTDEPSGRKCDLYPEYNAIFVKSKGDGNDGELPSFINKEHLIDVTKTEACKYAIKPGEGLSAVAFVKRMLHLLEEEQALPGYRLNIPSVAYMLLKDGFGGEHRENLKLLKDEASEAVFDLQNGQQLLNEYLSDHIKVAEVIYEQVQERRVSPYYALLKFDGDGMGRLYRDYAERYIQEQLSRETSHFAGEVREIISEHGGICIYAGGEDFLGFVPVNRLFSILFRLRQEFMAKVKAPAGHPQPLTFSAGIVIAHLMQPLGMMLAKTGEMERQAKELREEKNSFAIGLVKRSGEQLVIKSSFGEDGDILRQFHHVVLALSDKKYSTSFLHSLSAVLNQLSLQAAPEQGPLVRVLIEQTLQRSASSISKEERKSQVDALAGLFGHFDNNLAEFRSFLEFVAFISREVSSCSMPLMR
ncbi:type III-B CRISPR-associated protein Cas10/Cmr2 [Paenibacillus chitinolyticus]|uniref:type III-B CRISPR-associated protein Cas10/Cmr2 n=1 Tax=Paenibacillus chitinolyticus TaxID=79263 RepID=UPI003663597F